MVPSARPPDCVTPGGKDHPGSCAAGGAVKDIDLALSHPRTLVRANWTIAFPRPTQQGKIGARPGPCLFPFSPLSSTGLFSCSAGPFKFVPPLSFPPPPVQDLRASWDSGAPVPQTIFFSCEERAHRCTAVLRPPQVHTCDPETCPLFILVWRLFWLRGFIYFLPTAPFSSYHRALVAGAGAFSEDFQAIPFFYLRFVGHRF